MSHAMVWMLLQSWSSVQHIAEDPSSIDIHLASWLVHLKSSGNLESTLLQLVSARVNSWCAESDCLYGIDAAIAPEERVDRARMVEIVYMFVGNLLVINVNDIDVPNRWR